MKRSKFGLGLLLGLLILGSLSTWAINRSTAPITEAVRQAGAAALAGDWQQATETLGGASAAWEDRFPLNASLTDHEPMEQINSLFARLEVLAVGRDTVRFGETCARLAEELEAIGEAHTVKWWNIL